MPALANSHVNLVAVKNLLNASATEEIPVPIVADSRGSWPTGNIRTTIGEIFRCWDVRHAALINSGVGNNNGERDGWGTSNIGFTGITTTEVNPGATCPGSSLVNRLPLIIAEQWTSGTPSNPHFGRYCEGRVSAGGNMDSTVSSASTGGQFFRGDPAQGRNIQSITQFCITDTRTGIWLPSRTSFGYSGTFSTHGPTSFSAPPAASSGLLITPNVMTHGTTTGAQVSFWHRHTAQPATGTGIIWGGTKIRFGNAGITAGTLSVGGYRTVDHMPEVNSGRGNNANWKYTDQGLQETLAKVFEVSGKKVLAYVCLGQNQVASGDYLEWDGASMNTYKENMRIVGRRVVARALAAGAASVTVLLVCPWQSQTAFDRNVAMAAALRELAIEEGWSYLDLQSELVLRNFSTNANGLKVEYTVHGDVGGGDYVHAGWRGMTEAIGPTIFDLLSTARANSPASARLSLGIGIGL